MRKSILARLNNWIIFSLMTLIVLTIVIASTILFNFLRKEEIKRVDILVSALKFQQEVTTPSLEIQSLILQIYSSNTTIPVIILDKEDQIIDSKNIPREIENNSREIILLAKQMAQHYPPIELKFPNQNNQFVYYDNSRLLNNLRYSPYILGFFILSYFLFSFWFLRTIKKTDEGYLWAGLAKETAHQIGTPLSSMIGWIEIMKLEHPDSEGVYEIEKDIERLRTISERFSKIGSVPELNDTDFNTTIQDNYNYLKTRISRKVNFSLQLPPDDIQVPHNKILMSWVIENLVKNAVDAMKGDGTLTMSVFEKNKNILVEVKDTGSGMTKRQAANAFKPGYSTKKRGWGLGLSLAKRVVQEYHNGDIKIAHTEVGKGTTFRITIRKS
ncbi:MULTISPECIES: sensor histidine kinase [Chryseobacterium]|uniref:histidine kinase n=1 Tax=Chryseobacterium camelliae TaxID=1265445 RepID=A0ABU0THA0_9FLAO|nr:MULTISPECIES: HAMP domain-containing sensor histidine kinase [Chryseobacterium]MDT3405758.1 signal transduction histidine kinase [Pseudacidovorax intermedius]MDQ1096434.1 signal transduction histidine kinase [Chryseobacterium camelliae]MDQ1100375.1 signal transduction histidine kinase [Chryseobacterium sp. SORGH_AS_1048]MDR6087716.1 signal transduction histidine kinase [Chryseobacterium sp. SORGH_AS_0909]MDR6132091.1 signal transduction histidine kinase [Chryseobacterium sp. SORGH_AS_1175]